MPATGASETWALKATLKSQRKVLRRAWQDLRKRNHTAETAETSVRD